VVVVGGGLAGLAAAVGLAGRGMGVTLIESRNRLGGRASSFTDAGSDQLIDACQHVSMGCCTNLAHFARVVGIDHFLAPQPVLYFMTPDRRVSRFAADRWPAPFHLARSFAAAHYLTPLDKLRVAWGLTCLRFAGADADPPFLDWLHRHRQNERTIRRFWGLVLTSALNESVDRVGLRYARKVFLDGFLRHPRGFEVQVPTVPLARLYGAELRDWFDRHGVEVRLNAGAKSLTAANGRVRSVQLRTGEQIGADWFVAAVPSDRLTDLLPEGSGNVADRDFRRLETSPITSVHLWFDRPVTKLPHAVLIDSVSQWVFNRGEVSPGEHYLQVVVSAAREFRGLGQAEVRRRIEEEFRKLFPDARPAQVLRARVVTEHAATFSAVPGVDALRPGAETALTNLFLAGDWTATGWPATMEGAVRSGYLAAEALLRRAARPAQLIQPDLR
jgi:squalene-associated FAD-dependent desaturase